MRAMPPTSVPEPPQYRVNLFYGPESADDVPPRQTCVFNVKRRSWRSGVQVAVEVTGEQVALAKNQMGFDRWVQEILEGVGHGEREAYQSRAEDLLVQALCALKLDLAIVAGLSYGNQTLPAAYLRDELSRGLSDHRERLRAQILAELDVPV